MNNSQIKIKNLQKKYPNFYYHSYKYHYTNNTLRVSYKFEIKNLTNFEPKWSFPCKKKLNKDILDILIFNLGMAELVSYWKLTTSPNVIINCNDITNDQMVWWKKLYKFGLGEFYYKNGLDLDTFKMTIVCCNNKKHKKKISKINLNDKYLIPIGGGKDSIVTLELLKKYNKKINSYIVSSRKAGFDTVKKANIKKNLYVKRFLDNKLLELNKKGFLNGHTPFSSIIAFSALVQSYINKCKFIILSNESSANESTLISKKGNKINHQYSKSLEFENDLREYIKKYLPININYFSLLRPLNELQIAYLFTKKASKYFSVFRSCNIGIKENKWCCNCAKCLFVYIILSPFLSNEELLKIFNGQNLLKKKSLFLTRKELQGITNSKPFECVGTISEVNIALKAINNPFYYDLNILLNSYDNENNLPLFFKKILKENINRSILVWGKGLEGKSSYKFLKKSGFNVSITNDNEFVKKNYKDYYKIFISPGISLYELHLTNKLDLLKRITSQTNEFLLIFKNNTIGITGTKGKSTTSSIIYNILKNAKKNVKLIGNIGTPPFDSINYLTKNNSSININEIFVFEMSSHQLEFIKNSPHIAVLLNIYQDHLLHHGSVENYRKAKLNIMKFQNTNDIFIRNVKMKKWYKSINTKLLGNHNIKNIAFSWEVVKKFGIKKQEFIKSLQSFTPLKHRLQLVKSDNSVDYYNDSISTVPVSTINALKTLKKQGYQYICVIVGGFDRKIDYTELIKYINKNKNIVSIVLPNAGYRIATSLNSAIKAKDLLDSVKIAKNFIKKINIDINVTKSKNAILLSPAASSFDYFNDYKDRGNKFINYVNSL